MPGLHFLYAVLMFFRPVLSTASLQTFRHIRYFFPAKNRHAFSGWTTNILWLVPPIPAS